MPRAGLWLWALLAMVGSCAEEHHRVGGRVRGLWSGAGDVRLRLEAAGAEAAVALRVDGPFEFASQLAPGTPYAVTVVESPRGHTCVVDDGGSGSIAGANITNVLISCTGPAAQIELAGDQGWSFDPLEEAQTLDGSLLSREVAFTIHGGTLRRARVDDLEVTLDQPTAPLALPVGARMIPVVLSTQDGLSKRYELTFQRGGALLDQVVYGKASNPRPESLFGQAMAIDGDTLVVGAPGESSGAFGVDGDQHNTNAPGAGAVYVFVRAGASWSQQAYLKPSNTSRDFGFGMSVALSGDTLVVGAPGEASAATGINGQQFNRDALFSGAVYVFVRTSTGWAQQAYIKASNTEAGDSFGRAVALSGDLLAVGAPDEDSAATGIQGNEADNRMADAGAVYVFDREGTVWTQRAYLKPSNTDEYDHFGLSVALSGDTLIAGAPGESSSASGIDGNDADNSMIGSGAVYVFGVRSGFWSQRAYIKASNPDAHDNFGVSLALDSAGRALAVGAWVESSGAAGINGDQGSNSLRSAGAVYLFARSDRWKQQAYIKASNPSRGAHFGSSVGLSGDVLAVGANCEPSATTGVNGNQLGQGAPCSGAVYVFSRTGATWRQEAFVKASDSEADDLFGTSVALSREWLGVGAVGESSGAAGIGPPAGPGDNRALQAGAMVILR